MSMTADQKYRFKQVFRDNSLGRLVAVGQLEWVDVKITSAQLLALNATPQTVVAAPGAGKALIFERAVLYLSAGTAYGGIAAGEDLAFKYTNGAGAQVSGAVETTGFLDQATAQLRYVGANVLATGTTPADITPVANAPIVLQLLVGEITTGTGDLYVRVYYRTIPTVFPSTVDDK